LVEWARRRAHERSYDEEVEQLLPVAELIDRIYGRSL
jgi:hypothetical protein